MTKMVAKKKNRKKNKKLLEKERMPGRLVLPEETKKLIWGTLMFLIAIIVALSFFNLSGVAGSKILAGLYFLIGKTVFLFPLILILGSLVFFSTKYQKFLFPLLLAIFIFILGVSGIFESLIGLKQGGVLGYLVSWPFLKFFGSLVTNIIFGTVIIIASIIFWQLLCLPKIREEKAKPEEIEKEKPLITRIFQKVVGEPKFKVKEIEPTTFEKEPRIVKEVPIELKTKPISPPLSKASGSKYQPPPFDLLESEKGAPTAGDTRINSAIIKKTLQNFDIPVEMSEINIGPTVTQYTLKPAEGVKLSKITALANDLALALAAHPIRIEAPIPGKSLVGIEVPNKVRAQVRLRDLIQNPEFQNSFSNLLIALGRDVSGNPVYADLSRMPHLLVAGSTGTGKTIFLNSLILSLLYRPPTEVNPYGGGPEILRFILIDPKRVEFQVYNDLPHLLCPVIYDAQKTVNALKWLSLEMERRFDLLSEAKARDIIGYNETAKRNEGLAPLPYIVLIIDELADLMAARGREVEAGIVRLAQMSRAVGIHLVVATQRPSVEVITGLIKANITSRITFQVASQVDSRTVLDMAGAEKLLGLGDMLYLSAEIVKPKRIQGSYVSEKEVRRVVNYLKSNIKYQTSKIGEEVLENKLAEELGKSLAGEEEKFEGIYGEDPLYEEAKRVVIEARKASASLLQRRLRIGYARAARLIDMLEERGVVGPGEGAKPREVYLEGTEDKEDDGWQKI
jgi:S-DNA-T family DNA segregation ATPase FtsK/SpoIIIE